MHVLGALALETRECVVECSRRKYVRNHHNGRRYDEFGQEDDTAIKFLTGQVAMAVQEDAVMRYLVDILDEEGIDIEKESHNPNDYNIVVRVPFLVTARL